MSSYKYRVSILATFSIYVMAGREIFQKRQQLRAFNKPGGSEVSIIENPFTSYKTTEVHITSEPNPRQQAHLSASLGQGYDAERDLLDVTYVPYSITIERGLKRPSSPVTQSLQRRQHNVALEANTAAWGYLKCAMLFFISLLITWVPSSANRVYSLVHPTEVSFTANYAGGLVLPLMGFWNAVIYTTTSWRAVQSLFSDFKQSRALPSLRGRSISTGVEMGRPRSLSSGAREVLRPPASRSSFTDSMKRFAD
ncbi:hypothetical protein MMC19_002455 [Ptychographa xylographoides]|nr:hypothetical protein [Ptychographa xylographoides]